MKLYKYFNSLRMLKCLYTLPVVIYKGIVINAGRHLVENFTLPPSLFVWIDTALCLFLCRQKGGDLTQSYDKSPYTHGNVKRAVTTQTTPQKSSIKQRLRTDLGRSVGVTTATQLVWLTWFTGPTFPLPATAV